MGTLAITLDLPPVGELEISGDGRSPTDAQMEEEMEARQAFLALVSPYLESLPRRPPRRSGNVSQVELQGREVWSELNHYLLLVTIDIGEGGVAEELSALLPEGAQVSVHGAFEFLQAWPESATA